MTGKVEKTAAKVQLCRGSQVLCHWPMGHACGHCFNRSMNKENDMGRLVIWVLGMGFTGGQTTTT